MLVAQPHPRIISGIDDAQKCLLDKFMSVIVQVFSIFVFFGSPVTSFNRGIYVINEN